MHKKSFILYQDQENIFNKLNDEQAGKLIKAIFEYNRDALNEGDLDFIIDLALTSIKNSLDENKKKYELRCLKNKESADKRWDKNNSD